VKRNLARYKVPRDIVFVDTLPRNATGKILKRELQPAGADVEHSGAHTSNDNDKEA
jgi:fatty-acyl-CoA synthase